MEFTERKWKIRLLTNFQSFSLGCEVSYLDDEWVIRLLFGPWQLWFERARWLKPHEEEPESGVKLLKSIFEQ